MKNWHFYRLLHSRRDPKTGARMTTARLAELACGSAKKRTHISRVLNGDHGRGTFTRRRLYPFLTLAEVRLLGWEEDYNRWRRKLRRKYSQMTWLDVPRLRATSAVGYQRAIRNFNLGIVEPSPRVPRGTL